MIIGVFGPREHKGKKFTNYNRVADILDTYDGVTEIVTGGGEGVEQLALRYAEENKISNDTVPPNIKALGTTLAFKKRNEEIAGRIQVAVVLWDGKEKYTIDLIATLTKFGPVHVWSVDPAA